VQLLDLDGVVDLEADDVVVHAGDHDGAVPSTP